MFQLHAADNFWAARGDRVCTRHQTWDERALRAYFASIAYEDAGKLVGVARARLHIVVAQCSIDRARWPLAE
jgi:hypothetical protein